MLTNCCSRMARRKVTPVCDGSILALPHTAPLELGPVSRMSLPLAISLTCNHSQNVYVTSISAAPIREQSPIQGFKRKRPFGCRGPSKMKVLGGGR